MSQWKHLWKFEITGTKMRQNYIRERSYAFSVFLEFIIYKFIKINAWSKQITPTLEPSYIVYIFPLKNSKFKLSPP